MERGGRVVGGAVGGGGGRAILICVMLLVVAAGYRFDVTTCGELYGFCCLLRGAKETMMERGKTFFYN